MIHCLSGFLLLILCPAESFLLWFFPGPIHLIAVRCRFKMVTPSHLGPQIAKDGTAGVAFPFELYKSVVFSEYQEDKNRSCKSFYGLGLGISHTTTSPHSVGQRSKRSAQIQRVGGINSTS